MSTASLAEHTAAVTVAMPSFLGVTMEQCASQKRARDSNCSSDDDGTATSGRAITVGHCVDVATANDAKRSRIELPPDSSQRTSDSLGNSYPQLEVMWLSPVKAPTKEAPPAPRKVQSSH